jgi:thiamine-phosphate pyrophosphorylase
LREDLAEDDRRPADGEDVVDERASAGEHIVRAALEAARDPLPRRSVRQPATEIAGWAFILSQRSQGKAAGADYVIAGPIYDTTSHPDQTPSGLRLISDIDEAVSIPIIAIGGVREEHIPEVMEAGASGVAVMSAIIESDDPSRTARRLRATIDRYSPGKGGWD